MTELHYTITAGIGLHARPAGEFVKAAKALACDVTLVAGGKEADAKRLLAVMGLDARGGEEIILRFDGPGEQGAATLMELYLKAHL